MCNAMDDMEFGRCTSQLFWETEEQVGTFEVQNALEVIHGLATRVPELQGIPELKAVAEKPLTELARILADATPPKLKRYEYLLCSKCRLDQVNAESVCEEMKRNGALPAHMRDRMQRQYEDREPLHIKNHLVDAQSICEALVRAGKLPHDAKAIDRSLNDVVLARLGFRVGPAGPAFIQICVESSEYQPINESHSIPLANAEPLSL